MKAMHAIWIMLIVTTIHVTILAQGAPMISNHWQQNQATTILAQTLPDHGDGRPKMVDDKTRPSDWPLLFVDTSLIADNGGVSMTVCEATRHPANPVVRRGTPVSPDHQRCQFDGSVFVVDGVFRMWYWAYPVGAAYAESSDGIHWTKPDLGLVEWRGNRNNNLVPMPGRPMITYDPHDPNPQRRYKKPVGKPNPNAGNRESLWSLAFSPDGFHWNTVPRPQPDVWQDAESQVLTRIGETWVIYTQGLTEYGRSAIAFSSDSLERPPWEWERRVVWALRDKYPLLQTHHGIKPWARPGLTIGVYGIFFNRHELIDTTVDLGFALSQDGLHWREPWPRTVLLRRGPTGAWDSTFLVQGFPGFVNVGDKTYFYYSASAHGNTGREMDIGLATLRRDGFGFLGIDIGWSYASNPGPRIATFSTVPIRLTQTAGEALFLNVDNLTNDGDRSIQVELTDAEGKALPGYGLQDADTVTTNGIAVPVSWNANSSLENLKGETIRLRVHLKGGRYRRESPHLYAAYFRRPDPIEQ